MQEPAAGAGPVVDLVPLGVPGSGKGTASKIISEQLGIPHLSTGDMLRALDRDSDLGRRVFTLIDAGNFVSDELIAEMVSARLLAEDARQGIVLDGFPRTLAQLLLYDALCQSAQRRAVFAELLLPDEIAVERLRGRSLAEGRADDSPEVIARRLDVYRELTAPLVAEIAAQGRLAQVDALEAPDQVAAALLALYRPAPVLDLER